MVILMRCSVFKLKLIERKISRKKCSRLEKLIELPLIEINAEL